MPQFKCGTKEKDVNKLRRFKAEFINRPASELREWEESVTESRRKKGNAQSTAESEEEGKWNCQGRTHGCGEEPCIKDHAREKELLKSREMGKSLKAKTKKMEEKDVEVGGKGI